MAIQLPDVGTGVPADKTGDSPWLAMKKVRENFSDPTNAASKLVGTGAEQVPLSKNIPSLLGTAATKDAGTASGNVMGVGAFGFGASQSPHNYDNYSSRDAFMSSFAENAKNARRTHLVNFNNDGSIGYPSGLMVNTSFSTSFAIVAGHYSAARNPRLIVFTGLTGESAEYRDGEILALGINAKADSNGFYKTSSPTVNVYADRIEINAEAEKQNVTFTKNGIGDYTITTKTGLSTNGWYLELPKDLNGNPKIAVTLSEVDGVISLKSYKRIFSMETFTFEPDLDNPLDIPDGRWVDLRLNEIPVEPSELETEV